MKVARKVFLLAGLGVLVAIQALGSSRLLSRDGARIQWPEPGSRHGRAFVAGGDAWMAPGPAAIAGIELEARPSDSPGAAPLLFPAERAVVRYKGAPLFALPTWSAPVSLPAEGEWSLKIVATAVDGRRVESAPRRTRIGASGAGSGA
jgi:hypothetical protein